ncbi:MAG: nuclear transport factor 2 family protein [Planctomycetota bacterium]
MTTRALLLASLLLIALPAAAQERFDLSDAAGKKPISGTLILTLAGAELDLVVDGKAQHLAGALTAGKDGARTGTLAPPRGLAGAIEQAQGKPWKATLRRDGPLVSLRLARGFKRLNLRGEVALGARDERNEALIRRFYEAFAAGDGETMAASYAPEARFTDPVFPDLRDGAAGDMWKMLCESKPKVVFSGIRADARYAVAHWEADYELFGNQVHNVIEARFELRDGKIVRHVDSFDFKVWSRQAFGVLSRAVPSAFLQHVVRKISASRLATWQKEHPRK